MMFFKMNPMGQSLNSLKGAFPANLDNALLIDPALQMNQFHTETELKMGVLMNKHIVIPNVFAISNPNLLASLTRPDMKAILETDDLGGRPPLIITHRKDGFHLSDTVKDMLSRRVTFGILSERANMNMQELSNPTLHDFFDNLDPQTNSNFKMLEKNLAKSEQANYEIKLTPSKYKNLVLSEMESRRKNNITDKRFIKLCKEFQKEIENIRNFTRSEGMRVSKILCKQLDMNDLKIPFDQLILNDTWQRNLSSGDDLIHYIQGKPYEKYEKKISASLMNEDTLKNNSEKIQKINHSIVTLKDLNMYDIMEIRDDKEFEWNLDRIHETDTVEGRQLALENHVKFLSKKLSKYGKMHSIQVKKKFNLPKISSKMSRIMTASGLSSTVLSSSLLSSIVPYGHVLHSPASEIAAISIAAISAAPLLLQIGYERKIQKFLTNTIISSK